MTKAQAQKRLSTLYPQEKSLFKKVQDAREVWVTYANLGRALKKHEFDARNVAAYDLNKISCEYTGIRAEIDFLTMLLSRLPLI